MPAPKVVRGVLPLQGDLTLNTVEGWYRQLCAMWGGSGGPAVLDLAETGRIDSAGLALLLEWKARAKGRDEPLTLINPPPHLLRLAALSEATGVLGLEEGDLAGEAAQ